MTTWISVDANAVINYIRECALRDLGRDPTDSRAEMLRVCLDQERHVFVAKTAAKEAARNMEKDITSKLKNLDPETVFDRARELLKEYRQKTEREDEIEHVPAVQQMYANIKNDPANPKFIKWKKKKRGRKNSPVLGSDVHDLVILSTAVHYLQTYPVEFWTQDMDFTMFADEIHRTFGLIVVDTYRLGERSSQAGQDRGGWRVGGSISM